MIKILTICSIRYLDNYLFVGICNGNSKETRFFLKELQNLSKYILVDEKKYPWNESKDIEKMYYGNDGLVSILSKKKNLYIFGRIR